MVTSVVTSALGVVCYIGCHAAGYTGHHAGRYIGCYADCHALPLTCRRPGPRPHRYTTVTFDLDRYTTVTQVPEDLDHEGLLSTGMHQSDVGFSLADEEAGDLPIVWVSKGFERSAPAVVTADDC